MSAYMREQLELLMQQAKNGWQPPPPPPPPPPTHTLVKLEMYSKNQRATRDSSSPTTRSVASICAACVPTRPFPTRYVRGCTGACLTCCLWSGQKYDLGKCPKVHSERLKNDYDEARKQKDFDYELEWYNHLEDLVKERDRRIQREQAMYDEEEKRNLSAPQAALVHGGK